MASAGSKRVLRVSKEAQPYRTELTPVTFLRRSAYVFPDKTAVVHGERRYTYRQFEERVNRLASALRALGLRHLDRVAAILPEHPGHAGGALRRARGRAASSCRSTRGSAATRSATSCEHSGARVAVRGPGVRAAREAARPRRHDGHPRRRHRRRRRSLRGLPGRAVARARASRGSRTSTRRSRSTTRPAPPGRPKGVMVHHRGAYLNAIGEVIETRHDASTSTYLWTLPMFHCNGWCFTWGVTAMAGTHVCLRRVEPGRIWDLIDREGVTHYCGAPTVQIGDRQRPQGAHAGAAGHVRGGGRAAVADAARPAQGARLPPRPRLRPDRDVRAAHRVRLERRVGRAAGRRAGAARPRARGRATSIADLVRVVDEQMHDVPVDGETLGEVVMRGNNVMKGYFEQPEATRRGVPGRLVPLRRPRRCGTPTATSSCATARRTSSSRAARTSRPSRWSRRWPGTRPCMECAVVADPRREVGRAAQGVRHAQAGRDGHRGGDHRVLPAAHRPLQVPGRRRVRRPAQDLDRQGAEVRAARPRVEGPGQAHQLTRATMSLEQTLNDTLTQAIRDKDQRIGRRRAHDQEPDHRAADRQGLHRPGRRRARAGRHRRLPQVAAEGPAGLREGRRARPGPGRPAALRDRRSASAACPEGLDETALRALVRERLGALGITDPKQVGRVVGDVMKTHKGQVEAGDVKRIAEELLRAK